MRVDEVFKQAASQGTAPVSFEMFPPKGELTLDTAREVAGNLCKLSPSFVSVTCSAGGSGNGATTAPIAHMITSEFDTPSVAHLLRRPHACRYRRQDRRVSHRRRGKHPGPAW